MKTLIINIFILIYSVSAMGQIKVEVDSKGNIKSITGFQNKATNPENCVSVKNVRVMLKKIGYESDELTISGFVFEEENGKRDLVKVDGEDFKSIPSSYLNNLYDFLQTGSWYKIDYNVCGSGASLNLAVIKRSKDPSDYYSGYYEPYPGYVYVNPFYPYYYPYYYPFGFSLGFSYGYGYGPHYYRYRHGYYGHGHGGYHGHGHGGYYGHGHGGYSGHGHVGHIGHRR